jgi:hypothetical protein
VTFTYPLPVAGLRSHRTRLFPVSVLALLTALPVVRQIADAGPFSSALRMLLAIVDVGVLPGLVVSGLVGALASRSLPEAIAMGFGASFAIAQVLTVAAIVLHLSCKTALVGLWAVTGAAALYQLAFPRENGPQFRLGRELRFLCILAAALGVSLYIQTPAGPWLDGEEATHVAVIQRLAFAPKPDLLNIYWAPNFIYTYPFPGTHFFIALVSRAADLEPIFVYEKIRLLWGPIALCTLYGAARVIFASERLAFASALTAVVLTFSGAFGPVATGWGQLAPFSHAADVAMTVLLPALLLFAVNFAAASTRREAALFLFGTLSLVLTLAVVHIREVVQFVVYVGAACAIYGMIVGNRSLAVRFGTMTVITIVLVVAYLNWYQAHVGHVDSIVAERRAILITVMQAISPRDFLAPMFANPYFTANQQYLVYRLFPMVLLFAPIVVFAYRAVPLVPFVGAGLLAYAMIVFVPLVSIPYVFFTYYEILFTPVRNSLFFIYLLTGPLLLVAADAIGAIRSSTKRQIWDSLTVVVIIWIGYRYFEGLFNDWEKAPLQRQLFAFALIALYATALMAWPRLTDLRARLWLEPRDSWGTATRLPFALLLAGVAAMTFSWKNSPLNFDVGGSKWTFGQQLDAMKDIRAPVLSVFADPITRKEIRLGETELLMAPPSAELITFARRELPAEAVLVHNILNRYSSPVFMPQHILLWPQEDLGGVEFNARLFSRPWSALVRTAARYQVQPFFNTQESLSERIAYMQEVAATHVLLDPMYYARLRQYLSQWSDRFVPVFDDSRRWAVFEFRPHE